MPKRKRENDTNNELPEKNFSAIPPELVALMLVDFNDQALCEAGTISRQFLIAANLVFRERFRQINQNYFTVAVSQLSNFKLAYFQQRTAFQDAVNRIVELAFHINLLPKPDNFSDGMPNYLTPDQQVIAVKGDDLVAYYYLPFLEILRGFDTIAILQAAMKVIDNNKTIYEKMSIDWLQGWDSARRLDGNQARGLLVHMFIGTMRYDVIRLLLDKEYHPNDRGPFGRRHKNIEGDSAIDVMLAVSSYYQKKENRKDHGPSVDVLVLLSDVQAEFTGENYIKEILAIIESEPDHELMPSCLRLCAFLFLRDSAGQYQEESFVKLLSQQESIHYDDEKEVLIIAMQINIRPRMGA